ncbi:uncharacterized protein (TIGR03083 family) [Motilibacter peucedani]|uniref:Uncharacterized protein (TIGR03083 family) n=1 Tax=Motilibacter peucedani TaxID=598650 RepID=A0A420XKV7_9ACTN|nr:maleylpyruvate isomerase family mycothiol-dependent enzyme [Motilibacter peucedani]RKS68545.1 uncharacterized protein (TIGR03083 family) [Motilibacter peucedani]
METIEPARHLKSLRSDIARIAQLAPGLGDDPVPGCPGWSAADVVRHVAEVYLRQAAAVRLGHRVPPGDPVAAPQPGEEVLDLFDRASACILETVDADPHRECWTWAPTSGRLAFWQRRMAQETLVHRVDLEQAAGIAPVVAPDLAADGVDEVLTVFVPLSLPLDGPAQGVPDDLEVSATVSSGEDAWVVEVTGVRAEVTRTSSPLAPPTAASVEGPPAALLLWLWGRDGEGELAFDGDPAHVSALQRVLAASTQ